MVTSFASGFGTGCGLIMAIGAQNAFVLSNGLKQNHSLSIALVCSLCDAVLIMAGVAGLGALVTATPLLGAVTLWGSVTFLVAYGIRSLYSSYQGGRLEITRQHQDSLAAVLLTTLGVSLLNPHVYLDTVILMGSISAQYAGADRFVFAAGAMAASFAWFFSLSFGSRILAPLFQQQQAWRLLDLFVGMVMITIAASLLVKDLHL